MIRFLYNFIFLGLAFTGCQKSPSLFTLLDPSNTGVDFNNFIEEDADNNVLDYGYFYNGGGVASADFNNDGLVDLYFTGNMVANRLYLNQGEMNFRDISEQAGVGLNEGWKTGVSLVDINDDGWMDIYICRSGAQDPRLRRNLLYVNDGPTRDHIPTFKEKAADYGLNDPSYTTQAVFFDYDKDGDTDCFLLNHSVQEFAGFSRLLGQFRTQRNPAYGNKLLRNDAGKFVDRGDSSGVVSNVLSFGLGVIVSDFNNDGWQDLYITNDYNENDYLYLNQKDGSFKEVIRDATGHVSLYSMGADAADLNNDGWSDIVTLDMLPAGNERIKLTAGDDNYDKYQELLRAGFHEQTMRNMLQLNNGTNAEGIPVFSEIGQLAGVSNTDWSWAALIADYDNDGNKDIFVTNGYARDYTNMEFLKYSADIQTQGKTSGKVPSRMEVIGKMPPINQPNYIFRNEGELKFSKKTDEWGLSTPSQSNGAVYTDLDNDGDLDLVVSNINQKAFVYQNNTTRHDSATFVSLVLKTQRYALRAGARVTLYEAGGRVQVVDCMPVRGFQSAMDGPLHFGTGGSAVDSVSVTWTDGKRQVLRQVSLNRVHVLDYAQSRPPVPAGIVPPPLFVEKEDIAFTHQESQRNDFRRQPLLPQMQSYQGPCLATGDINRDGLEDVYVGGARRQAGGLFVRKEPGYQRLDVLAFAKDAAYDDSDAVFFDADGDGDQDLLVTSAGYDLNPEDTLLRPRLYLNQTGQFTRAPFPEIKINASCIAVSDVNRDGKLDVFIGERVQPGNFPASRGGYLLINGGKAIFSDQTSRYIPHVASMGMVTEAIFQDLNLDGVPELVVSSDWGRIGVFEQVNGLYRNASEKWGTASSGGLWTAMTSGDLDGDGDIDFVVGNMGTNEQWSVMAPQGLALYADSLKVPFTLQQPIVPVVSLLRDGKEYPYASRDELLGQISDLKKKFPTYTGYAGAVMSDIFPMASLRKNRYAEITEYRTGILENIGNTFRFRPLPVQAQFAPVHAIALADLTGDGLLDILLGGNHSKTRVRIGRTDANLGQLFVNQGKGRFFCLPQAESGLYIRGDVRSLIVVNQATKVELMIGSNNQPLKTLYMAKNR